jgi:hypothetical protein
MSIGTALAIDGLSNRAVKMAPEAKRLVIEVALKSVVSAISRPGNASSRDRRYLILTTLLEMYETNSHRPRRLANNNGAVRQTDVSHQVFSVEVPKAVTFRVLVARHAG